MNRACIVLTCVAGLVAIGSPARAQGPSPVGPAEVEVGAPYAFRSIDEATGKPDVAAQEHGFLIPHANLKAGTNQVVLEFAGKPYSGQWMVFDYISLKSGNCDGELIAEIGRHDRADYSEKSFAEFETDPTPEKCPGLKTGHVIGTHTSKQFCKDINDADRNRIKILVPLTAEQAKKDVCLFISSRYASHDKVPSFPLRIVVVR